MKKILLTLLLLFIPALAHAADEDTYTRVMRTHTLRCGYFSWPPYFSKDPATGALNGITYDIVEKLGKILNLKIEWPYEYTLGQQVEALKTGKIDALCGDGPWTRSALPYVDYTHPYLFIPGYVYVPEGNPKQLTIAKLNAPDIAFTAMDGDGSGDIISLRFPKAKLMSLPASADPSLLIQNVLTGKAQAMVTDPATSEAQNKNNKDRLVALNPEKALITFPFVISVAKKEQAFLNTLNQGVDVLRDTGAIDQILKTYDPKGKKFLSPQPAYTVAPR